MPKGNAAERKWYLVDAEGKTLGRLASEVAGIIRGKHKPDFTPHVDGGDFVIVINADKIELTGKKLTQKMYYRHSHYPGGLKATSAGEMLKNKPDRMIELAVHGMLPKNRLGDSLKTRIKVYAGAEHPHQAQQPEVWELRG
jgi:large subunit ribosomal protein L13